MIGPNQSVGSLVIGGDGAGGGAPGPPGENSFTTTTAPGVQPIVGANVTLAVADSAWAVIGQNVFLQNGGYYEVIALPTALSITLKNLGYPGNLGPAAAISGKLGPAGVIGPATTGSLQDAYDNSTPAEIVLDVARPLLLQPLTPDPTHLPARVTVDEGDTYGAPFVGLQGGAGSAGGVAIETETGANSDALNAAQPGGAIQIVVQPAGDAGDPAQPAGGAGGPVGVAAGDGGDATTGGVGGAGGFNVIAAGRGGDAEDLTAGAGGIAAIASGAGGDSNDGVGGAGGAMVVTAGIGGDSDTDQAGDGGIVAVGAGQGGVSSGPGGIGGTIFVIAGSGGESAGDASGIGGDAVLNGGAGANAGPAGSPGNGGLAYVQGGSAGNADANPGTNGGIGGDVQCAAGNGGIADIANGTGGRGGGALLSAADGGTGDVGGEGGGTGVIAGDGGNAATLGGAGGGLTIRAGDGGNGATPGIGGDVQIDAGSEGGAEGPTNGGIDVGQNITPSRVRIAADNLLLTNAPSAAQAPNAYIDPSGKLFESTTPAVVDAADVTYTPATPSDWGPIPTEVAGALDGLAAESTAQAANISTNTSNISALQAQLPADAGDVTYTPSTPANWTAAPNDVGEALDDLAVQAGKPINAPNVAYTPSTPGDWTVAPDDVREALDDLAVQAGKPLLLGPWIIGDDRQKIVVPPYASTSDAALVLANQTIYSVYLGFTSIAKLLKSLRAFMTVVGTGTQNAEMALASTPLYPAGAGQVLTKLALGGALTAMTVAGGGAANTTIKSALGAGAGYNALVSVHLWASIWVNMTTAPTMFGNKNDMQLGTMLQTAASGAPSTLATWTGALPADVNAAQSIRIVGSMFA